MGFWNIFKPKPKFSVGDTVKCIDDRNWNETTTDMDLTYGKSYNVLELGVTSCCGHKIIDIGARYINPNLFSYCGSCNKPIQGKGIYWVSEYKFAHKKLNTLTDVNEAIDDAIASEDYEKAANLRDLKSKME